MKRSYLISLVSCLFFILFLSVNIYSNPSSSNPVYLYFRNSTGPYLNQNMTVTYGNQTNVTGICIVGNCTLYRNGEDVTSTENNTNIILPANTIGWNYTVVSSNTTHTLNSSTYWLKVSKAIPTGSLTISPPEWIHMYPTEVTINYSENNTGDGNCNYTIYRNDAYVNSGETITLGAGTYTYILNTSGCANYSSVASIDNKTLVINKAIPFISISNGTHSVNTSGLVGYWRFESVDSTNYTLDSSGHMNDGLLKNFNDTVTGRFGNALGFDGNDYIEVPNTLGLNITEELAVVAWVRPRITKAENIIWSAVDGIARNGYAFDINFGKLRLLLRNATSSKDIASSAGIPLDKWTHVVAVYSSIDNYASLYINGIEDKTESKTIDITSNTLNRLIGKANWGGRFFNGTIDEVMIFNRTLSATEIALLYETTKTYPIQCNFSYYEINNGDYDVNYTFYRNKTSISSPDNTTFNDTGYYYYFVSAIAGTNYTRTESPVIPLRIVKSNVSEEELEEEDFEEGIEIKIIGDEQDVSKQSTDKIQYMIAKVNVTNKNRNKTIYKINSKISVPDDGTLLNSDEGWKNSDKVYHIIIDKLIPLESRILNISYYGDWIDVEFREVKQDFSKQSTLERQYVVKEALINSSKKISWKDILVSTDMSGNCSDCVKNVSICKPILWLSFDEDKGDIAYDKSEFGNNGFLKPNVTAGPKWFSCKYGNGLEFDGDDDYVDIKEKSDFEDLDEITVMGWVKFNDVSTRQTLIGKYGSWELELRDGKVWAQVSGSGFADYGTTSINANTWYHFAFTYSNLENEAHIYLNGIPEHDETGVSGKVPTNVNKVIIGALGNTGQWDKLNGMIDEVKIWNRALNKEEIKKYYLGYLIEEQTISFHSSNNWIIHHIKEPKKLEIVNQSQFWNQKIILNNTANIDLYNISIIIPSNLRIEQNSLSCLNDVTNLSFNNSMISFTIPKLERNKENIIYEINFSIPIKKIESSKLNLESKGDHITGMFDEVLSEFITSSSISGYFVIIDLICMFIIISYIYHDKGEK